MSEWNQFVFWSGFAWGMGCTLIMWLIVRGQWHE